MTLTAHKISSFQAKAITLSPFYSQKHKHFFKRKTIFGVKAGLFDSKRHFLFSSKYDTLRLEERYGRCFKGQFYLFLCLRRVLSKPLQKWLWLPWQRDVAFFSFTPIAIPKVHPITKNPKAIPRGSCTTSYMT